MPVELINYDSRKCQMALTMGNNKGFLGEWCIQTVSNNISGFEPLETKLFPEWRTSRKSIEYFLQAHGTLLDSLVNRAA